MLIEIEGIDGAGKTTQSRLLKRWIVNRGINCAVVREPAGTEFGRKLKELIMSGVPRDRKTETFSFLAAKTQLYSEIIIPALAKGKCVITDRGSLSFLSYHHIFGGLDVSSLQNLLALATNGIVPTLTVLIDTPVEIAMDRVHARKDPSPFDRMGKVFFERQRNVFLRLCDTCSNCAVIDGSLGIEEIHEKVKSHSSIFIR
jgi:dTMP kinase